MGVCKLRVGEQHLQNLWILRTRTPLNSWKRIGPKLYPMIIALTFMDHFYLFFLSLGRGIALDRLMTTPNRSLGCCVRWDTFTTCLMFLILCKDAHGPSWDGVRHRLDLPLETQACIYKCQARAPACQARAPGPSPSQAYLTHVKPELLHLVNTSRLDFLVTLLGFLITWLDTSITKLGALFNGQGQAVVRAFYHLIQAQSMY